MTVQTGGNSVVTQHPPKHAATQTIATKMNCSFVLCFAILEILMSETPFPSEQRRNGQQPTHFDRLANPSKSAWTTLHLPLTPASKSRKALYQYQKHVKPTNKSLQTMSSFPEKDSFHCLHKLAITDKDSHFSSPVLFYLFWMLSLLFTFLNLDCIFF